MKEKREEKLLRLWKIRQEREGVDVSKVTTLAEAEEFYSKKNEEKKKKKKKPAPAKGPKTEQAE